MIPTLPSVNDLVRLAYADQILPSRVEDIDGADLLVAAPEGIVAPEMESALRLHWSSPRGACEVPVVFLGVEAGVVGLWRVEASGSAEMIQRREYARARAEDAQAALVPLRPAITSVRTGWILDISEGGARCAFPTGQVQADEEVELHLDLGGPVVVAVGTTVRVSPAYDGSDEVVVTFEVSERVADEIRAYVFSRQRRAARRSVRR